MDGKQNLTPSVEDYLEAIHRIISEKGALRAKDIAERLGVTRPSVSGQLKVLAGKGLVNYAPYDVITLTTEGERIAQRVDVGHRILRDFLVQVLEVEQGEADEAACKMEHGLTAPIRRKFEEFVERYGTDTGTQRGRGE